MRQCRQRTMRHPAFLRALCRAQSSAAVGDWKAAVCLRGLIRVFRSCVIIGGKSSILMSRLTGNKEAAYDVLPVAGAARIGFYLKCSVIYPKFGIYWDIMVKIQPT